MKNYQIWGELAQEQKITGKNKLGGGEDPLAYRVNP